MAFVVAVVVPCAAFLLGQKHSLGQDADPSLSDPTVLRAVISAGLYLTALGPSALGLAVIIRHTAAAISTFVAPAFHPPDPR